MAWPFGDQQSDMRKSPPKKDQLLYVSRLEHVVLFLEGARVWEIVVVVVSVCRALDMLTWLFPGGGEDEGEKEERRDRRGGCEKCTYSSDVCTREGNMQRGARPVVAGKGGSSHGWMMDVAAVRTKCRGHWLRRVCREAT